MQQLSPKGVFFLILAQCCIAANVVLAKHLVQFVPILMLLGFRFVISALMLNLVAQFTAMGANSAGLSLTRFDKGVLLVQALCAGLIFNLLMVSGLQYTSATEAGIIMATMPAMIALLSYWFLKENLSRKTILAIAVTVVGLIALNLGKSDSQQYTVNLLGNALVLLAVFPESLFTVIAKWHSTRLSPIALARVVATINAVLILPFALWAAMSLDFSWQPYFIVLLLLYGLFDALFYFGWYKGLTQTPASIAALFTAVMPVSATLFAMVFLGEIMHWLDYAAMCLIIVAIVIGSGYLQRRHRTPLT